MIITIDVDLTICDPIFSSGGWYDYLKDNSHSWDICSLKKDIKLSKVDYDLANYFNVKENIDPYDFWRQKHLYENITPYEDTIEYINKLCKNHDIVFLSHCKGSHMFSKARMLDKYFPNKEGFMATKEKHAFPSHYLIDDRNDHLNKNKYGESIKFGTIYTQKEDLDEDVCPYKVKTWEEMAKKKKHSPEESKRILDEMLPDSLDLATGGAPTVRERTVNTVIDSFIKNSEAFNKLNDVVRDSIVARVNDIAESIDRKNIGKSRVVWVENPSYDITAKRTDTDNKKGEGDNPFFVKTYEPIYNPYRYKDNIIESNFARILEINKETMKQLQNIKKEIYKEIRAMERAKEEEKLDDEDNYSIDSALDIDFFEEDSIN